MSEAGTERPESECSAFSFIPSADTLAVIAAEPCTTSESLIENKLVEALGASFFEAGAVTKDEVPEKVVLIKAAFEDSGGSDEELVQAITHKDYALARFLLRVVISNGLVGEQSQDSAAKCLAFAGDIHSNLWLEFCSAPPRLLLVLRAATTAVARVGALVSSTPSRVGPNEHGGYLGYDERDVGEYAMEGYHPSGDTAQELDADKVAAIQEAVMVWLLLLFQVFSQPLPALSKKVVSCRTRKNTSGRTSSRRLAKGAPAELTTDLFGAETVLDNLDLVSYFTALAEALLDLLRRRGLHEDAHNNCVKVLALVNAQLPRLQQADSTEVAALFVATDCGQAGENLSQDLLHLLNEVGYPQIHGAETLAVVRLCKDVLQVEPPSSSSGSQQEGDGEGGEEGEGSSPRAPALVEGHYARGHFYTNDVKVMVDIAIRELSNVPHNTSGLTSATLDLTGSSGKTGSSSRGRTSRSQSTAENIAAVLHGQVRFAYLELVDALVSKSTWSSLGDCYLKDALRGLLEETAGRGEDPKCQAFAQDLLQKYAYYLS